MLGLVAFGRAGLQPCHLARVYRVALAAEGMPPVKPASPQGLKPRFCCSIDKMAEAMLLREPAFALPKAIEETHQG